MRQVKIKNARAGFSGEQHNGKKWIPLRPLLKSFPWKKAYVRLSETSDEIITDIGEKFMHVKKFNEAMPLFSKVAKDVNKFCKEYATPEVIFPLSPRETNRAFNSNGKLVLTDIKHAYWRIAYLYEIISEQTYQLGLSDTFKETRNKALAVLGTEKRYEVWKDGQHTGEYYVMRKENPELRQLYSFIRNQCYYLVHTLSEKLGNDWVEFNTDGITYLDTEKNRKLVERYLASENMLFRTIKAKKKPVSCGGPGVKSATKKLGRESGIKLKKN